jgi:hypothetical protein
MIKNIPLTIFIFFSLLVVIIASINIRNQIDEPINDILTEKVVKYLTDDINAMVEQPKTFNNYYLLFDQYKLNTKNFIKIFSFFNQYNYEYHIMAIYPYINPLYQSILTKIERISLKNYNLNNILDQFYQTYTNELTKYNLDYELESSFVNGITIRMIKIYTSNEALYTFLNKYPTIKYSLNPSGIFKTI